MRAFLWRWRWRLLLTGLCLAAIGSVGVLLLDLRRMNELRQAFDRVQLGTTESDVQASLEQDVVSEVEKWPDAYVNVALEAIEDYFPEFNLPKITTYELKWWMILVEFGNGRAVTKCCYRRVTVWDKLQAFLGRIRAAVGL